MASTGGKVRSSSSDSGRSSCPKGLMFRSPAVAAVDGCRIADHTDIVSELMGTGNTALRLIPLNELLPSPNELLPPEEEAEEAEGRG